MRRASLARQLWLAAGVLKWAVVSQAALLAAGLRSRRQIIAAWPETPALSERVAIFMHFDAKGRVSAPALFYLRQLAAAGYSVAFVTNAGRLSPAAEPALREICAAIFVRRNIGYDFGAWAEVIETLGLPRPQTRELLILNDSMYGPLKPLEAMLARLDYSAADIWGLTESWQHRYHLQSFFLGFGEKALRCPAFAEFWRDIRPAPFKSFIIRAYEIGLTQKMLQAGLLCRAIWPYDALVNQVAGAEILNEIAKAERLKPARTDPILQRRRMQIGRIRGAMARQVALNPTADLWRQLLHGGFPFIKRELLRKNPAKVEDIGEWITVLRDELGLDPEPILAELRRGLKNRAP